MYLAENGFGRNEMCCAAGNQNAKGFLDSNLNYAVIDKISNFQ